MDYMEAQKVCPPNFDPVTLLIWKKLHANPDPTRKYLMDELLNYLLDEKEDNLKE